MTRTLAVVAVLAAAGTARADDHSYRLAIGATDAVAGTVFVVGVELGDTAATLPLMLAGGAIATVVPPTLHGLHDNWGRLGISLAAHLALPPAGLAIGLRVGTARGLRHIFDDGLVGLVIGHLAASALDVAMAYRDGDPNAPRTIGLGGAF